MEQAALKELLFDALELEPEERDDFVRGRCGDDEAMCARVLALIEAHDRATGHLEAPSATTAGFDPTLATSTGEVIAGREVVRVLGEGGFGVVYLVRETDPMERLVALKIIRPGYGSGDIVARFQSERRVLALMNHPGVAQVFGAGETEDGRPYVLMEYVDGPSITEHCINESVALRDRVELMERACRALHHAHQKGVIHRDVKPSNVLVSMTDGRATPKVIDFGIAKALEGTRTISTPDVTATRQIIGTPQYMSPEQASAGREGVDTRADVYALGVLLYECLSGGAPFERARLARATPGELERIIREEEPPKASTRAERLESEDARKIRGELDWITVRAMEKDPERRYPSAMAMAMDLRRWLDGHAVDAGPPSGLYRLRKAIGRRRLEFASASVILAMIIAGSAVSLVYASIADRERRDARAQETQAREQQAEAERQLAKYEQISTFTEGMLSGIDPAYARGADTALLERMLEDAEHDLIEDPPEDGEVLGSLRLMIALAYRSIGDFDRGAEIARLATDDMTGAIGPQAPRAMEARNALAVMLADQGLLEEALEEMRVLHAGHVARDGASSQLALIVLTNIAAVEQRLGRYADSAETHETAYRLRLEKLGPDDPDTAAALNGYAMSLSGLGRHEEALPLIREVLRVQTQSESADEPRTLATRNNLAALLMDLGRWDEAADEFREVLAIKRRLLPAAHPSTLITCNNLGSLLRGQERSAEAVELLEPVVTEARTLRPADDAYLAGASMTLGLAMRDTGRGAEATAIMRDACDVLDTVLGTEHERSLSARAQLASTLAQTGLVVEARELIDQLMLIGRTPEYSESTILLTFLDALSRVHEAEGDPEGTLRALEERYLLSVERSGPENPVALHTARRIAEVHSDAGNEREAERWRALGSSE